MSTITHISNPDIEYEVIWDITGPFGRAIVGKGNGEFVAGQPMDFEDRGEVLAGVNGYASEWEAATYAHDLVGAVEPDDDGDGDGQPGFCIYGCVDYHLADCPVFDRTGRENEEANW